MPKIDFEAFEDLVNYSKYFGKDLIELKEIRDRQDSDLLEGIVKKSTEKVERTSTNYVEGSSFFIGSVDFMVHRSEEGKKEFSIIETNGGSSRGLSILHEKGWERIYRGFEETFKFTDEDPLVLIGHPKGDRLVQEKIFLAENIASDEEIEFLGRRAHKSSGIVMGAYDEILPRLELDGNVPIFDGEPVDVMIGDGIVRRQDEFERKGMNGELETVLVNEIFPETDDKALTYEAVNMCSDDLEKFRIHPLDYRAVSNREELIESCKEFVDEKGEAVIKPYGGSGGNGVNIITDPSMVEERIEESLNEFFSKFGEDRRAFPYTICEKVNFRPIEWEGAERNFDIRIYVARVGDEIIPCGGLARIALESVDSEHRKKSFVVNLSGYEGIDVGRGVAISKEGFDILDLNKEDFVDLFSASVVLFNKIVDNHENVLDSFEKRIEKTLR